MSGEAVRLGSAIARPGWLRPRTYDLAVRDGSRIDHFRRQADRPDRPWTHVGVISDAAIGPADLALINATVRARVPEADGAVIYEFSDTGWVQASEQVWIAPPRPSAPTAAELDVPTELLGGVAAFDADWPQAVADVDGSIYSYQRRRDGRWQRSGCVRLGPEPVTDAVNSSVKRAQVTGERDATVTPWGERPATLSRSRSSAGVRGTDLGVRVDYAGRSFLLFGDTHWSRPWLVLRDSIAEVFSDGGLPQVRFHGSPLRVRGEGVTRGEYDVPLDAFGHGDHLYALFSSNHGRHRQVMGRSVLARCTSAEPVIDPQLRHRPLTFNTIATLSQWHFINVSVQRRPAAEVPGAGEDGEVLLIWGMGSYRSSEIRLAMLDAVALDQLEQLPGPVSTADLGLRYWDGDGWADEESAAVPLFRPGAYGELSVRWVEAAGRYAMLLATGPGDAAGNAITLRWAETPAGPWTERLRLLDWVAEGMSADRFTRFIKASADDPVAEAIFPAQAKGNGAAYAPYFFDARRDGDDLVVRYTLSTWNPYQVVLMEHRLVPGEF
jgi:hypothetical protein